MSRFVYKLWRKIFKASYGNAYNMMLTFGLLLSLLETWKFIWATDSETEERGTSNLTLLVMLIFSYLASLPDTFFMLENESDMENKNTYHTMTTSDYVKSIVLGAIVPPLVCGTGLRDFLIELTPAEFKANPYWLAIEITCISAGIAITVPGVFWTYAPSLINEIKTNNTVELKSLLLDEESNTDEKEISTVDRKYAAFSILYQVFSHPEFSKLTKREKTKLIAQLVPYTFCNITDHGPEVLMFTELLKNVLPYGVNLALGGIVAAVLAGIDWNLTMTAVYGEQLQKLNGEITTSEIVLKKTNQRCATGILPETIIGFNFASCVAVSPTLVTLFVNPYSQNVPFYYLRNISLLLPLMVLGGIPSALSARIVYKDAVYNSLNYNFLNFGAKPVNHAAIESNDKEKTKSCCCIRLSNNRYRTWAPMKDIKPQAVDVSPTSTSGSPPTQQLTQ